MAIPMRNTDFRSIVEPIMNDAFDGVYNQRADEWKGCFEERRGTPRNSHEEPVMYGFGAAPEIPDGNPVTYDSGGILYIAKYIYRVYGLAFALTKVLVEDGDHIRLGRIFSEHLAQSMIETKETVTVNLLNRSYNASYLGGDGAVLVGSTHPTRTGTFSNVLATPAVLSQTSLEQMLIMVRKAVDNSGRRIRVQPVKLIVGPDNVFQAEVLLKSVLRTGTSNNDINPVRSMGMLSQGVCVLSRLTSATAWWIKTDSKRGLSLLVRRRKENSMEGDFETDSMRYKSTERYVPGWTDPRAIFGTPGV